MALHDLGTAAIPQTDGLSAKYSAAADASGDPLEREAAMLFAIAEQNIEESEDFDGALATATAALCAFRGLRHREGEADALRLVIHAHRLKANELHVVQDNDGARKSEAVAEKLANQMAASFRALGDNRGEAAMLLSASEVTYSRGGSKHWKKVLAEEAFQQALEARTLAKTSGDEELQAHAILLLSQVHEAQGNVQNMLQLAGEAQSIFAKTGNTMSRAKALHIIGKGRARKSMLKGSLEAAEAALALYRAAGCKKLMAAELYTIASRQLKGRMAQEALKSAEESLAVIKQVDHKEGCHAIVASLVVDALIALGKTDQAVRLAEMSLNRELLVRAHLAAGYTENALQGAEEGLQLCRESGNKLDEANITILMSQILSTSGDNQQAATMANAAARIFRSLGHEDKEASAALAEARAHMASGDAADALQVAQDAMEIAQVTGDDELRVAAGLVCGQARVRMGTEGLTLAMVEAEEARKFYECQEGAKVSEAAALQLMAEVHSACEEYEKALKPAKRARLIMQEVGDRQGELNAIRMIASLHVARNRPGEAVHFAKQAGTLSDKLDEDWNFKVETLIIVSQANFAQMRLDENTGSDPQFAVHRRLAQVVKPAQDAVDLAEKFGSSAALAYTKYVLGNVGQYCYSALGKSQQLEEMLQVAVDSAKLYRKCGDAWGETRATVLKADVHAALGRRAEAMAATKEALSLAKACGDRDMELRASEYLQSQAPARAPREQLAALAAAPDAMASQPEIQGEAQSTVQKPESKGIAYEDARDMVISAASNAADSGLDLYADTALMEAGLDSLAAIEFRNQLQKHTELKLAGTVMFDYPTVRDVAQHIAEVSMQ